MYPNDVQFILKAFYEYDSSPELIDVDVTPNCHVILKCMGVSSFISTLPYPCMFTCPGPLLSQPMILYIKILHMQVCI